MFDARQIANEILKRAWDQDVGITQLQINKIVYFLHGHHLKEFGVPLVKSEFRAWEYGPVHTALRAAFKCYGNEPITELATKFDPVKHQNADFPPLTDNQALTTIDHFVDVYLEIPTNQLVIMTHAEDTPWSETMRRAEQSINIGMKIPNSLIKQNFEGISKSG